MQFEGRFIFAGYRTGAVIAESLVLADDERAVTLCSPGLPQADRKALLARGYDENVLSIYTSKLALVSRPVSKDTFLCTPGSVGKNLVVSATVAAFGSIWALVKTLGFAVVWAAGKKGNTSKHEIEQIMDLVEYDKVQYTPSALFYLGVVEGASYTKKMFKEIAFGVEEPVPEPEPVEESELPENCTHLDEIPECLGDMEKRKPYVLLEDEIARFIHFAEETNAVLVPLCGITGMGKTTIFTGLLEQPANTLPTGGGRDNSKVIFCAYFEDLTECSPVRKIYLLDVPGDGGSIDVYNILSRLNKRMGCVFVVLKGGGGRYTDKAYRQLRELSLVTRGLHNETVGSNGEDNEDRIRTYLDPLDMERNDVLQYNVFRDDRQDCVNFILESITNNLVAIDEVVAAKKEPEDTSAKTQRGALSPAGQVLNSM